MSSLTLALVPLDERPVNTRCPQMLGAIGGVDVQLPPAESRGLQRIPAALPVVAEWLCGAAATSSAAIVSCDFLGYGNLINARISQDSAALVLSRLSALADINSLCPVHAFSLITRVSNADDAVEEPGYWAQWGTKFYRYARLAHQAERGALTETTDQSDLARLESELPAELKADWLTRRLRNHTVNLGLLEMAARAQLASLLITSDDTGAYGFPTRERDWLHGWPELIGHALTRRVMMHPGADEVASALVSRLLMQQQGRVPRIFPVYSLPGDREIVAPYEDRPVRETVWGQIAACGGTVAAFAEECDLILGVATPSPRRRDYQRPFLDEDRQTRTQPYQEFLARLGQWQSEGKSIALADVAYPNGSDPLLTELLLADNSPLAPGALCAYGAWNTAGNTLGTTIAQACCALSLEENPARAQAQNVFLAHRFLEDWGYQAVVRREARDFLEARTGRRDPRPEDSAEQTTACWFIEGRLNELLAVLQARGVGKGLKLVPGSVRLPWRRTFEVDFMLA